MTKETLLLTSEKFKLDVINLIKNNDKSGTTLIELSKILVKGISAKKNRINNMLYKLESEGLISRIIVPYRCGTKNFWHYGIVKNSVNKTDISNEFSPDLMLKMGYTKPTKPKGRKVNECHRKGWQVYQNQGIQGKSSIE